MKKNFILSVIFVVICFILLIAAIILNILEEEALCTYAGMASCAVAFISVLFGLSSWKDK